MNFTEIFNIKEEETKPVDKKDIKKAYLNLFNEIQKKEDDNLPKLRETDRLLSINNIL